MAKHRVDQREGQPPALARDPDEWLTGDEEMTAAQRSYLHTLATEAGESAPERLTKAEASKLIDELQKKTGRGGKRVRRGSARTSSRTS